MTALVSLLFIAMIPIDCKITIFFLHLYYKAIDTVVIVSSKRISVFPENWNSFYHKQ